MDQTGPVVMIADRNANIRDWLRREFGREGLAVETAGSGAEVLTRLSRGGPVDVLVLDVEIESPDGEPLAASLARNHPELPVVLHVFPGLEPVGVGVARVAKGDDFERLRVVVRQVLAARTKKAPRRPETAG